MKIRLLSHPFVLAFVFLLSCLFSSISFSKEIDRVQLIHELPSHVYDLIKFDGEAFFMAGNSSDSSSNYSLMRTDGTRDGTIVVKNSDHAPRKFLKGEGSDDWSRDTSVTPLVKDGFFYFLDETPAGSTSLVHIWKSNGTTKETVLAGRVEGYIDSYAVLNNSIYFLGDALWVTDGTPKGTRKVASVEEGKDLVAYKNRLYFSASDPVHDKELWVSDGTSAGTKLFKDINPFKNVISCSESPCLKSHSDNHKPPPSFGGIQG